MNGKFIIAGLVLATVAIIVWVMVARRDGGANAPPAVAANEMPNGAAANNETSSNDASPAKPTRDAARNSTTPTETARDRAQDDTPRVVMGEDVPALPVTTPTLSAEPEPQAMSMPEPPQQEQAQERQPPAAQPATSDAPSTQQPRPVTHAQRLLDEGIRQANAGRLVEARQTLSMSLEQLDPYSRDADTAREALGAINEILVFSSKVAANDPFARSHKVQSGEFLSTIAKRLGVDWKFIARINGISDPSKMQAGQAIKVIDGRFHVIVRKAAYELDLYLGEGSDRVFVRSFKVGLGELDSTPVGRFAVSSRVPNPDWKNPRTGEYFDRNDPKNPIGEFWIGMKGIEEKTKGMTGYGIHGTIDLDSIGSQASMGCVRMLPDDIALIYEVLTSDQNTVEVVP